MKEVWLPVPYEHFSSNYLISNLGRIKVIKISIYSKNKAAFLKPSMGANGRYQLVSLCHEGKTKSADIHRMVALAFLGGPPVDKKLVCHLDGNSKNNRVDNLVWGSNTDNMRHMIDHGHSLKGTQVAISKLTDEKVREIRKLYASKSYSQMSLARTYGVHQSIISDVVRRRTWKHV